MLYSMLSSFQNSLYTPGNWGDQLMISGEECFPILVWYVGFDFLNSPCQQTQSPNSNLHLWMAQQTVFLDSDFWSVSEPMQWFPLQNHAYLMHCCLRAWTSQTSNTHFLPCPQYTEISPDSLNGLILLRTVDHEKFKVFEIFHEGMIVWNCLIICRCSFSQISEFLPNSASLKISFFYPVTSLTDC